MKKYFLMAAALMMGAAVMTSCSDDDEEEVVKTATLDFESDYFAGLIDKEQYGGPLLYSADAYQWKDENTTLSSNCEKEDWAQWGMEGFGWKNGLAISNYVDADEAASYKKQLSVPVSNGSKNFAVVWDNESALTFADGKARVVSSMDVCMTTYTLNNVKKAVGPGYKFYVTATATLADGTTKDKVIMLADESSMMSKWTTVRLEDFGAVKSISFSFNGTDKSQWGDGIATPKYFALDNVVVVL